MRPLILTLAFLLAAAALEDPRARFAKAHAEEEAYYRSWLATANVDPIPEPASESPGDPRQSEQVLLSRIRNINDRLVRARSFKKGVSGMDIPWPLIIPPILEADALRRTQPASNGTSGGQSVAEAEVDPREHKAPSGGFVAVSQTGTEPADNRP